jgi:hypothetical protein
MSALRIVEKKIVLCKKGDEITGLDGIYLCMLYAPIFLAQLF